MKNRTAGALIASLAVVCLGLLSAVVYPVTTFDADARGPPGEGFTVRTAESYSATGSIVVDGDVKLAFDGVVAPDGAWYQKVVAGNVTSEEYHPGQSGTVYERLTISGSDRAERRREQIIEAEDRDLVSADVREQQATFVVEQNGTGDTEPVSGTASVFVRSLSVARYEVSETDSSAVTHYEPQSGWYEGSQSYRIAGATGEVRADAETGTARSANVSWDVTTPAGTYAEFLLAGLTSDDPTTHRITFELDPADDELDRPPWVDDAESE